MMLIKALFQGAGSDEEYKKKLRNRQKLLVLVILLGLAAVISGIALGLVTDDSPRSGFLSGLYTGAGTGAIVLAAIYMKQMANIIKDEARLRRERIKESDERSIANTRKAGYVAGVAFVYIACAAMLVAAFFSMAVLWTLWCCVIIYSLIFILVNWYYTEH